MKTCILNAIRKNRAFLAFCLLLIATFGKLTPATAQATRRKAICHHGA